MNFQAMYPLTLVPSAFAMVIVGVLVARLERSRRKLERRQQQLDVRGASYQEHAVALLSAARQSPAAVIERLETVAWRIAPAIEASVFAELKDQTLTIRHAKGMHASFVLGMRLDPEGPTALAHALRAGHRVATGMPQEVESLFGESAYIATPLVSHGRILGVIGFFAACPEDLGDMNELVRQVELAAPAYDIATERCADTTAAKRDGLTGLLRPVVFRQYLAEAVLAAQRRSLPYSLIFIDTDHFKACNDSLGHAAGDAVLTAIAMILERCGGPDAIVGRNGGDEFCIALQAPKSTALRLAERIRQDIAQHPYAQGLGVLPPTPITASIGVAACPDDAPDARHLLEAADGAMYRSKRDGRNRVSLPN